MRLFQALGYNMRLCWPLRMLTGPGKSVSHVPVSDGNQNCFGNVPYMSWISRMELPHKKLLTSLSISLIGTTVQHTIVI